jgi:hypothetical protein
MDAQTYYFLEDGLPEFAAPAGPPAEGMEAPRPVAAMMAHAETSRQQPLPAQRRDRSQRPVRPAAPLGRPAKPAPFAPRLGAGPSPARAEWTRPRRPTERPAKAGAYRPDRTTDKRPARPPGRGFSPRTTGEPGKGAGVPSTGPRPDTRGRVRPDTRPDKRAGGGTGAERRERPAPWARPNPRAGARPAGRPGARPGERSASAPRPPYAGEGGHSPFRERPKPRPGSSGGLRGGPGGDRVKNTVPGRPSSGRPQGRPEGRRPEGLPPAGGNRPWAAKRPPGRPQGKPAVPFRSGPNRSGSTVPRSGPPQGAARGPARGPGVGPGRSGSYDRPRPGGYAKSGDRSGAKARSEPSGQGARPPFKASTRPSISWPRASSASGRPGGKPGGKPGKPPARFRGGKPSGKKPGA